MASIIHLPALYSDYKRLIFITNPNPLPLPKPFRFEAMWIDHPNTSFIIQEEWSRGISLTSKLKHTKVALKEWNKLVFGDVYQKLQQLRQTIEQLQNQPQVGNNLQFEQAVVRDLTAMEKQAEIFWKERAKTQWIEEGYSNTHYFHVTTLIHRRYNRVDYLKNAENTWIYDRQSIGAEFETHFCNIFANVHPNCHDFLQELIHPVMSSTTNTDLIQCLSPLEIKRAIFSMGNYKSPGPDSMTVTFYKYYWGIIHEIVTQEVQDFFCIWLYQTSFQPYFLSRNSQSQRSNPS